MKAMAKQSIHGFKPISIEITLESEEEVGAFFSLFNYGALCDLFGSDDGPALIREEVCAVLGNIPDYMPYHEKIHRLMK
jgi:hypothetical protein